MPQPLEPAALTWNERGEPRSSRFDDKYFSVDDGLDEVRYLFLGNNGLPQRWRGQRHFVVGETGFGTGLNFLATWAAWRETADTGATLHFLSVERFPLTRGELERAHRRWSELEPLAAELRARWPPLVTGTHRLELDGGRIRLTLLFGDATTAYAALPVAPQGGVEAWYLDGFAPGRNPAMWSEALFRQLARLSTPGATLATFTIAGFVRRGLEAAGFRITKVPGHGRKKQMLRGEWPSPTLQPGQSPRTLV